MAVTFDDDKLVINLKPDFYDEEMEKLDKKITSHLDWVAQSLRRIRMTAQSDFVSLGSALIGTPSKKVTKKKVKPLIVALTNVAPLISFEDESTNKTNALQLESNTINPNDISLEDQMELITLEEPNLPLHKTITTTLPQINPTSSSNQQLLTDDDSLSPCVTPPKAETRALLKRPSRFIQSALSAAKVIEPSKRVKGSEYRTPSLSSSRMTRSKARVNSSPVTSGIAVKSASTGTSKTETPLVLMKKGMQISKSSESVRTSTIESSRIGSQTTSSSKNKKVSRLLVTPNSKMTASKPKVTDSASKRWQAEEERRLQALREKLEREQRAKEKKMDYLNKKVLEHKSKREEREKKVAILKKKNEEKKLEQEKKKLEKEDIRQTKADDIKQKELLNKKLKNKPWASSESVRKEDRIQILNKKQEENEQKMKQTIKSTGQYSEKINANLPTKAAPKETNLPVSGNKENVNKTNLIVNSTYNTEETFAMPKPYSNYDIDDLKSDDGTDDERQPKKEIPSWARGPTFIDALNAQFCKPFVNREMDIKRTFHSKIEEVVLEKIFKGATAVSSRYEKRTSSACWSSPPANHINGSFSRFKKV